MKALLCEAHGLPETLVLRDVAVPEPGNGEVRIRVAAAGVNFPDALIIQNLYQTKPPLPFSPGSEVAGVVDALGDGVSDFAVGDRVAAMTVFGAFSEMVICKQERATRIPDSMPYDIASGFVIAYGTSYHALKQRAQLQPGETVLVLGAGGGVGLSAVELAKRMGAHVIAAASSETKLSLARQYGADETLDYGKTGLREGLKTLIGNRGVDVVYDPVGGALAEQAMRSLAWKGRYLVIGFAAGTIPALPLNLPLLKGASIVGVYWGTFTERERDAHLQNMRELFDWYDAGLLKPFISRRFGLNEGSAAIRWVMDGKALGKVVLTVP